MNQFGGVLGGPVLLPGGYNRHRNTTFFFFDYERIRVRQAQTFLSTAPTADFKRGNFTASPNRIFDPATGRRTSQGVERDPYPNNAIPPSQQDRVGRNLINLYPDPNLPGITSNGSGIGNPTAGQISSTGSKSTLQRTSQQIQFALKVFF